MIIGLIAEEYFDQKSFTEEIEKIKSSGQEIILCVNYDLWGREALEAAYSMGLKVIIYPDIDRSGLQDLKPIYDRYHEIIDKSDVLFTFRTGPCSDSIRNAQHYARKHEVRVVSFTSH